MQSDIALSGSATLGVADAPTVQHDAVQPRATARAVEIWLFVTAGLIAVMVVLGGITRLTDSGLSIAEWAPLMGTLPPLSDQEWQRIFGLYQQIPQFHLLNPHMTLAEFKDIFWWEYIHRLWGRLLGLGFVVPLIIFALRRQISPALLKRLVAIFALGGLQGFVGWFMVQSGLADRVSVSHYRLAIHLMLALALFALVLNTALDLRSARIGSAAVQGRHTLRLRRALTLFTGWFVAVLIYGAFVAGLDAGFIYNTFPGMNGVLLPDDAWLLSPGWLNFFDNPTTVQFSHRVLAISFVVTLQTTRFFAAGKWDLPRSQKLAFNLFAFMATGQALLGIATLLLVVPLHLAILHQLGAVLMVAFLVNCWHKLTLRSN